MSRKIHFLLLAVFALSTASAAFFEDFQIIVNETAINKLAEELEDAIEDLDYESRKNQMNYTKSVE